MRSRFNIRGAVQNFIRGGAIRGSVFRRVIADEPVEQPRARFAHVKPKLYVGTDRNTAVQIAKYAESRQGTPAHILSAEIRHFFTQG